MLIEHGCPAYFLGTRMKETQLLCQYKCTHICETGNNDSYNYYIDRNYKFQI